LLLAFVIPFMLWTWSVGLVVYLHHTHPEIRWYADKRRWKLETAQLASTVHLVMPWPLGPLIHHIMEHPAHHLDATIPLYQLKRAQQHLKDIGAGFTSTRFTLGYYRRCVKVCQLYDYRQQRWVPFPN
jgi:omega-6 fatty acid desaturase (delta-12 desaturase)